MQQRLCRTLLLICLSLCIGACETRESRKEVVRGYLRELLVAQHWQKWNDYMSPSARYSDTGLAREGFEGVARFINRTFSEVTVTVDDQRVDGEWVVTRITVRGIQTGNFFSVPPSKRPVSFRAILLDQVEHGHVVAMWHQFDYWGALLQVAHR